METEKELFIRDLKKLDCFEMHVQNILFTAKHRKTDSGEVFFCTDNYKNILEERNYPDEIFRNHEHHQTVLETLWAEISKRHPGCTITKQAFSYGISLND